MGSGRHRAGAVPRRQLVFVKIFTIVDDDGLRKIQLGVGLPARNGAVGDITVPLAYSAGRQLSAGYVGLNGGHLCSMFVFDMAQLVKSGGVATVFFREE